MKITVVGTGYVGLVTSAVFAKFNNQVFGLDIDQEKIDILKKGKVFFYEPGLEELVQQGIEKNNLHFTTSYKRSIPDSEIVFICVGTPPKENGDYNLEYVLDSAKSIAKHLNNYSVITVKSTVPPGTNEKVKKVMEKQTKVAFDLASCP
jgi:UDPglucose 6-dehydrogenase